MWYNILSKHKLPSKEELYMANRVTIRIHNQNYNILAEEDESYIQQCAEIVKSELDQAMAGTALSITQMKTLISRLQ